MIPKFTKIPSPPIVTSAYKTYSSDHIFLAFDIQVVICAVDEGNTISLKTPKNSYIQESSSTVYTDIRAVARARSGPPRKKERRVAIEAEILQGQEHRSQGRAQKAAQRRQLRTRRLPERR